MLVRPRRRGRKGSYMLRGRKLAPVAAAGVVALALITACGSSGSSGGGGGTTLPDQGRGTTSSSNVNTVNSATPKAGTGRLDYTIEKNIQDWNLNTVDGNTFD